MTTPDSNEPAATPETSATPEGETKPAETESNEAEIATKPAETESNEARDETPVADTDLEQPSDADLIVIDALDRGVTISGLFQRIRDTLSGPAFAPPEEIRKAIDELLDAKSAGQQIRAGLRLAREFAEVTPGEADDRLVASIERVAGSAVINWLGRLLNDMNSDRQFAIHSAPSELDVRAAGLPWLGLASMAYEIWQLLRTLRTQSPD